MQRGHTPGRVPPQFSLLTHFLPGLILHLAAVSTPIWAGTRFVEWTRPGFVEPDLRTELGPPEMGLGPFPSASLG